uniref:Voltage-gated hydrogen channel 1 n=1 Tax=Saccoglossus kowalevskii TaxID=10224 RepID=A0ABM0GP31_SACKO|nr:PREDICTED: voltage-gated hydrogen channel 1-like [Saccoglossus kowalevskii]
MWNFSKIHVPYIRNSCDCFSYHHHYHKMDGFGFKRMQESKQDGQLRVITKDDTSDSLASDSQDEATKKEFNGFRGTCLAVMNHHYCQVAIVVLVILDVIFVLAALVLDMQMSTPSDCGNSTETQEFEENTASAVLHYCSLTILSLFMIEISLRIYCMRLEFFKHKLEVFDAVIVIISFSFDVAYAISPDTFHDILGLLVIFRLWRVVRIFNGVLISVKNQNEKKLAAQRRKCSELEQELEKFRQYCTVQENEIELLRDELKKHGITLEAEEKKERPQSLTQVDVIVEVNKVNEKTIESLDRKDFKEDIDAVDYSDVTPDPPSTETDKSPTRSTSSTIPESPQEPDYGSNC